ncbi:MAG: pilus assembly protein [Sphingomonadales bacterium]|nr:pilus assembly protein [Sphingomonadales bacterium]MDE2568020.1 pilus assembly protein [Sphingomonadales bacterium]
MARRDRKVSLLGDESGAVAATYAIALTALVVAAGVGYDFARMATLSSELHSAADQAALAAATQLDGSSNAITNATAAASNLVQNNTLLANDGSGPGVSIGNLTFYATCSHDSCTDVTTDPTLAKFVMVEVIPRKAYYALTPVVSLFSSGNIHAAATAGLGSAICKVPPVMMCNPNGDPSKFDVANFIGDGILLTAASGGQGGTGNPLDQVHTSASWAPGDFGYLDVGSGGSDLAKLMAYGLPPDDCVTVEQPSTEPGALTSVIDAFNTRFDIYDNGVVASLKCDSVAGGCPPSDNSRKDVVQSGSLTLANRYLNANSCTIKKTGWGFSDYPYRPTTSLPCGTGSGESPCAASGSPNYPYPDVMGYPRDRMHAYGDPLSLGISRIGDGKWDLNAYWHANYGAAYANQVMLDVDGNVSLTGSTAVPSPTRYQVYQWERLRMNAGSDSGYRQFGPAGSKYTEFHAPMCKAGSAPGAQNVDRRVIPVAVVNCTGLSGKTQVTPIDWIDVFLTQPSLKRTGYTNVGDIYVEVIGKTSQGTGGSGSQFVRHDKPYLVN